MSDLISRQAAINEFFKLDIPFTPTQMNAVMAVLKCATPSALVTCANCRHCEHRNNDEPYCHQHAMVVTPDYYCADGEEGEWMP